jgi:hypothetical protein
MNKQSKTTDTPIDGYLAVSGSALIAQFMEVKEVQRFYDSYGQQTPIWYTENDVFKSNVYSVPKKSFAEFLEKAKYESSWDWLMPVVEKICRTRIGDGKEQTDFAYPRTFGMLNEETGEIMVRLNGSFLFQSDTLISATYGAVIDFIQWWSKQADR